jgi:hypothetical protein
MCGQQPRRWQLTDSKVVHVHVELKMSRSCAAMSKLISYTDDSGIQIIVASAPHRMSSQLDWIRVQEAIIRLFLPSLLLLLFLSASWCSWSMRSLRCQKRSSRSRWVLRVKLASLLRPPQFLVRPVLIFKPGFTCMCIRRQSCKPGCSVGGWT